ncbi:MAG: RagB/SusD family nutrient uptake outer membrane protein [Bacteroidetes bacterium]|nr:RagB/SusD family nutrient uptake outer membrane protein [Bacteroidota bacterium]
MKLISFKYKSSFFLTVIIVVSVLSSCKKLIEIPANPPNQLSANRVFSDSADIIAAMAGVYSDFGLSYVFSPTFGSGAITIYTGLTADEFVPGSNIYVGPAFYNNAIVPDNTSSASLWTGGYKSIFDVNICLEGISGTNAISAALKRQLTGELKVTRAFCYFNLINLYGAVPLVTTTDYTITQTLPRTSRDSVFAFIVSDLTDAVSNLTATYPSAGRARPNLYVAQALLSKVYLYLGRYQEAITAASAVIAAPGYSLTPTLPAVFLNGSTEAIWQLPAIGNYYATPEAAALIPYSATSVPNNVLSPYLLNAFETNDLRKTNWTNFTTVGSGAGATNYYYPTKYKNTSPSQQPIEDYMFLRLADVLLIRAEALAQNNNLTDALTDLNKVRARAGLGVVSTTSKTVALNAIMHERQVELFCEWGNRWFDLKRTKTIDAVLGAEKPSWKPTAALFPVPTAELQANPFLTQNPGYN